MPFASNTAVRICGVLGIPLTAPFYLQRVQESLEQATAYGGEDAVTLITDYLDQYEDAQSTLNTNAGQRGLIKADVLEWVPGGQVTGYESEMARLKMLIAQTLHLENLITTGRNRVTISRG